MIIIYYIMIGILSVLIGLILFGVIITIGRYAEHLKDKGY